MSLADDEPIMIRAVCAPCALHLDANATSELSLLGSPQIVLLEVVSTMQGKITVSNLVSCDNTSLLKSATDKWKRDPSLVKSPSAFDTVVHPPSIKPRTEK